MFERYVLLKWEIETTRKSGHGNLSNNLFNKWFQTEESNSDQVLVLHERDGGRELVMSSIVETVADHLVDLEIIEKMGGFTKSAAFVRNRLPEGVKQRSGDMGEILATEFVNQKTKFSAFVKRLRYKDDRNLAMRGDDVLGFRQAKSKVKVLKVEAKSRAKLSPSVIREARDGLAKYRGRPNPGTLGFLEYILRKENRDTEAELIARLQRDTIRARDIRHLVFTLSGNDPTRFLESHTECVQDGIPLSLCGCRVSRHGAFIKDVFDSCLSLIEPEKDGVS
ncbi:Hachiman antiphage defense system protein HamA [Stieleria maiorica]|nr:Hachiman antiphage defense system protein HamA [Stieleria maiorica]